MDDLVERLGKAADDLDHASKHGERTMEVENLLREAIEEIKRLRHADIDLSMLLGLEGEIPADVKAGIRKTLALIDAARIAPGARFDTRETARMMQDEMNGGDTSQPLFD